MSVENKPGVLDNLVEEDLPEETFEETSPPDDLYHAMTTHFKALCGKSQRSSEDVGMGLESNAPVITEELIEEKLVDLMTLESLMQSSEHIHRGAVVPIADFLPDHAPLESFTTHPTKVNRGVALESVGGAIQLVAAVGVVALLGGLGVLLYKMVKRRKARPNLKSDKAMTIAFASIDDRLKTALTETRQAAPDIKHPELNWSRQNATAAQAAKVHITLCGAHMFAGKYPYMEDRVYALAAEQGKQAVAFLDAKILPELKQLEKKGTEDDISGLETILSTMKVEDKARPDLLAHLKKLGVEVGEDSSPYTAWKDKYGATLDLEAISKEIGNVDASHRPMSDQGIKKLAGVQESITKVYNNLDGVQKRMKKEETKTGGNYATKLKELVAKIRVPLSSLTDTFSISDAEVAAFNKNVEIKKEVVLDGYKFLQESYERLRKENPNDADKYKECIKLLAANFAQLRNSMKG